MDIAAERRYDGPAFEAAERRFEIAAAAAGLGVWQWNLLDNSFEYSPRAKQICGFALDGQVTYQDVEGVTHPEDLPRTLDQARRSFDPVIRAKEAYRYRIIRPDGQMRWVIAHGEANFAEMDGKIQAVSYIGTLQDITEQKQAEDALVQSEARHRLAVDAGKMAVWEIDLVTEEIAHSEQLNRLCGFAPDARPTLEDLHALYAPGERERVEQESAAAQARGETGIETEVCHIWPDGTIKWLLMRAQLAPPREGEGPKAIGVLFDITERKLAVDALREGEKRLRMSQEAAGIGSLELDIASGEVIGSEQFFRLWGLSPRESVHISVLENIVVPEDKNIRSNADSRRAGNAVPNVEYRIRRPDTGELRWLSRNVEFTHDSLGRPAKMFGVMQDVTERKLAEARQKLLTHELEHRIKNILSMVSAIASQTLRNDDIETARQAFLARLRVLANAHDILTETRWTEASLQSVLDAALAPHIEDKNRVALNGPALKLTPKMALSLALAVNELATNATKYGALSAETGRVDVNWTTSQLDDAGAAKMVWTWRESGGPKVTPPTRRGFGSILIKGVLAADFGGSVDIEYLEEGVLCSLSLPLINLPR